MALGTIISGAKGSVVIPVGALSFTTVAINGLVIRWTMSIAREEHDTTTFAVTSNFREWKGGMASFTGRCEGYLSADESLLMTPLEVEDQAPVASFSLVATTNRTYGFAGLITGVDMGVDKGAHTSFAFTFRGSGQITAA
ncbi:hypothetical protein LCGC14_1416160 [marine sediment metagenome]|uniref:Uncharacterized protein n=1 Tax=marine sediment metagenome TaxID=412755 RepID=A0A0F9MUG5_9ZZZZ